LKITFDIKNLKLFNKKLDKRFNKDAMLEINKKMNEAVAIVRNHAIESIQRGAKTGVTYEKYNPRRTHTASVAGQPPATDTGFLVSSITSNVKRSGKKVVGQIVASAPYAPSLEFGTSKMAARPFMVPALEKNRRKIERKFKQGGYIKK